LVHLAVNGGILLVGHDAIIPLAPGLQQEERIDLMTEVLALTKFAADSSVSRGLAGLVALARTANEATVRTI
jgi:hypothetical protein